MDLAEPLLTERSLEKEAGLATWEAVGFILSEGQPRKGMRENTGLVCFSLIAPSSQRGLRIYRKRIRAHHPPSVHLGPPPSPLSSLPIASCAVVNGCEVPDSLLSHP